MAKIVCTQRFANKGQYLELDGQGNPVVGLLEESYFEVEDQLFQKIQSQDLVQSFWTNTRIVPDGTAPRYKDAAAPDNLLTQIFTSDNFPGASVTDLPPIRFTAADYGYENDFSTELPDPS